MREIKYRQRLKPTYYRSKNEDGFHYWGFVDGCFHSPCNPNAALNYEDSEQYTGLKDKNGVEIFEGDVLSVSYDGEKPSIHEVKNYTESGYPAFDLFPELSSECNSFNEIDASGDYEVFVIGNVHVNPELLESDNE